MTEREEGSVIRNLPLRAGFMAVCCALALTSQQAAAHKLSPEGTTLEQHVAKKYSNWFQREVIRIARWGVDHFSEPVHEEITQRIYGCEDDRKDCTNANLGLASQPVVAGVRWNDDPPFQLQQGQGRNTSCKLTETIRFTTQPRCWYQLFRDAQKRAQQGEVLNAASGVSLLGRSHYGDLQFFHAMASGDGEVASETQRRIMMWAEFAWRVARGEYSPDIDLKDVSVSGLDEFFGHSGWRVQDLFTLGNSALRPKIKEVAFGSLLHMVEDSFARGHVERAEPGEGETCPGATDRPAPGHIKEFHSYIHQDPAKHAQYDSRKTLSAALLSHPNVIEVGKGLVSYYENNSTWEQVKPYLDCLFWTADPQTKAGPGAGFERTKQARSAVQ